jgi:hypothetical protein
MTTLDAHYVPILVHGLLPIACVIGRHIILAHSFRIDDRLPRMSHLWLLSSLGFIIR